MSETPPQPVQTDNTWGVVMRRGRVLIKNGPMHLDPPQALSHGGWLIYRALSIDPELRVNEVLDHIRYRAGSAVKIGILRTEPGPAS